MSQNTDDDLFIGLIIAATIIGLPSLWIARSIGADFSYVVQAFFGTLITLAVVSAIKYFMYEFRISRWGIFGILAIIFTFWKDVLYSSAFNYINPDYVKNDIFDNIGEPKIAWWGENWVFYVIEFLLIGLSIFFWYKDSQKPY